MQKWEYLFAEVVSEQGGTFHHRLNNKDQEIDTVNWTSRKSFNDLGDEGWELISAILKDKEWSAIRAGLVGGPRPFSFVLPDSPPDRTFL